MAFLSLLDDRARPKGSRDPLGFEMVWTHFGRRVVGNLTTITSSWRIFAVGLLGFHWCNQLCRDAHSVDKQHLLQEHFIRYEQLAAYLRSSANDDDVMGIRRVRKRLSESRKTIDIGTEQRNLILSDQVSYGIWGLYSSALRETGLVQGDFREPTARGLEIVKLIEDRLSQGEGQGSDWYWTFLRGERKTVTAGELEAECQHFQRAISTPEVEDALITALLRGPDDHCCQLALYKACRPLAREVLHQPHLGALVEAIRQQSDSDELRQALDDISQIERLLVTANMLFNYIRRQGGEPLAQLAETIERLYRFDQLPAGPALIGVPYEEHLGALRERLRRGDTLDALRSLLELNKTIMRGRGGAAWVEESGEGLLKVRVKSETAYLLSAEELQARWDYDYFLRSYARIAAVEQR